MIIKLLLILFLTYPIASSADRQAKTLLISLFFGSTPPDTISPQQPGNRYSIQGKRLDNRLIQIKTLNNRAASVELATREFTAALYHTLTHPPFEPSIAANEIEQVSGFHVHPLITEHGIEVNIDAKTQHSSTRNNTYRIQTSILTREGKWTLLTGEIEKIDSNNRVYKTKPSRENMVWIKASIPR